jgi:hypothetical protein
VTGKDLIKTLFTINRKRTLELLKRADQSVGIDAEFLAYAPEADAPHAGWLIGHIGMLTTQLAVRVSQALSLEPPDVSVPPGDYAATFNPKAAVADRVGLICFVRDSAAAINKTIDAVAEDDFAKTLTAGTEQFIFANALLKLILDEANLAGQVEYLLRLFTLAHPESVRTASESPGRLTVGGKLDDSGLLKPKRAHRRGEEPSLTPVKEEITREPTDIIIFEKEDTATEGIDQLIEEVRTETEERHKKQAAEKKAKHSEPPELHDI